MTSHRAWLSARARWCCGLVTVAVLVAGCSVGGATTSSLLTPTQEAQSAVSSAVLALDLLSAGRSTTAVAQVVVEDGVDELASAEQTVATLEVSKDGQRQHRDVVLAAIRQAVDVEGQAREALVRQLPTAETHDRLVASAARLSEITAGLQAER